MDSRPIAHGEGDAKKVELSNANMDQQLALSKGFWHGYH